MVTTAKGTGYLTQRKQVEFKFFQDAIGQAFGFTGSPRSYFDMYLPLVDEWTDRIVPQILVRGQPILVRREGVRKMPGFADLKRLLNPPFDPNGVRPLSTLLDYSLGFPCGPGREQGGGSSGFRSDPSRTFADIFGGPPPASSDVEEATPTRKRKSDQTGADIRPKALKLSFDDDVTHLSKKHAVVRDIIEIHDDEDDVLLTEGEACATSADCTKGKGKGKWKGKARATLHDEIIDLTV